MKAVYGRLYETQDGKVTLKYWHPDKKEYVIKIYDGPIEKVLGELDDGEAWEVIGITESGVKGNLIDVDKSIYYLSNDIYSIPEEKEVKSGKKN